ncbi:Ryanodine receptor 1 [Hondaea fermentalgiana]|uniref:Ryanodine receptor 1 n=1 Tax=Hondaea fermentalgiana TaxID=2315210 RepID=A0A2R5FZS7_9STRA|nr:Ryanodine receptor 1 [Hondaea fermentalgiana]|eukprot:GBG24240.1 Ryanodine receptor 1 [Hondaea fermentalgiana]
MSPSPDADEEGPDENRAAENLEGDASASSAGRRRARSAAVPLRETPGEPAALAQRDRRQLWQDVLFKHEAFLARLQERNVSEIDIRGADINEDLATQLVEVVGNNLQHLRSCRIEASRLPGRGHAGDFVEALGCHRSKLETLSLKGSAVQECGKVFAFRGSISHDEVSGVIEYDYWSTVLLKHVALNSGRWFYEVAFEHLASGEFTQIGWATPEFTCNSFIDGVGDDAESWAFDTVRRSIWHDGQETNWGERMEEGDTLCCVVDFERGELAFGRNGSFDEPFGVAFEIPRGISLRPALTAGKNMRLALNVSGPQSNPHQDALPISEWIRGEHRLSTQWFVGSICRLAARKTLRTLDLSNNYLDAASIARIIAAAQALPIESLLLAGNNASRKSALAVASLLAENGTLRVLDLSRNCLGLKRRRVSVSSRRDDKDLNAEEDDEDLNAEEDAEEQGGVFGSDGGSGPVGRLDDPREHPVSHYLCNALAHNSTLTTLLLGDNALDTSETSSIAEAIVHGGSVRTLSLAGNKVSSVTVASLLSSESALEDLDLSRIGLSEQGAGAMDLLSMSAQIRRIVLRGNPLVTPPRRSRSRSSVIRPTRSSSAREAEARFRSRSSGAAKGLAVAAHSLLQVLSRSSTLESVDLGNTGLDFRYTEDLARLVVGNPALEVLRIDKNMLESESMETLARALETSSLQELDVSENPIGAEACAQMLFSASKLNVFVARMCEIGLETAEEDSVALTALTNAVRQHESLVCLNIGQNALRSPQVAAQLLGSAICDSTSLRRVNMSGMGFGLDGIRGLVQELQECGDLDELDLSENDASYKGMQNFISFALDRRATVKALKLSGNSPSDVLPHVLESLASLPFGSRLSLLRRMMLTVPEDPGPRLEAFLASSLVSRHYVWTRRAMDIAETDLSSLSDLLRRIQVGVEPHADLWTVRSGLHFHNVEQDLILDESFQIFDGELCFDDCRGDISIPENLHVDGFLNFMRCSGEVLIGAGLHVDQDVSIEEVPRLTTLPANMYVGGAFFAMDCDELGDFPADFVQAPDRMFVLQRCPSVGSLPDTLVQTPGRMILMNTGISSREIVRLQGISHEGMSVRSPFMGALYILQPDFTTLQAGVKFWVGRSKLPNIAMEGFAREVDQAVGSYFRTSVTQFLSKLRMAKEFQEAGLRQGLARRVVEVLRAVVDEVDARDSLLVRISDSVDACGDKPIWALNQMQAVIATARARGDRQALRELGQSMMRLGVVHEHARRKVLALERDKQAERERRGSSGSSLSEESEVDEICVYLFFEIELRERLGLTVAAESMLFPNFIPISAEELDAAANEALAVSEEAFDQWLASWPEWQRQLRFEVAKEMSWASVPLAHIPKRVSLSQTTFLGDPLTEPVLLGKAGPWQLSELLDRWIETGMDFNNVSWGLDAFVEELGRLEPARRASSRSSLSSTTRAGFLAWDPDRRESEWSQDSTPSRRSSIGGRDQLVLDIESILTLEVSGLYLARCAQQKSNAAILIFVNGCLRLERFRERQQQRRRGEVVLILLRSMGRQLGGGGKASSTDASMPKKLAPLDHIKNLYDGAAASLAESTGGNNGGATRKIFAKKDLVEAVREMNAKPGVSAIASSVNTQSESALRLVDGRTAKPRAASAEVSTVKSGSDRRNVRTALPSMSKGNHAPGTRGRLKSASEILQETLNFNAKKYNDLKVACAEKETQLNQAIDELASLQVENESLRKMELHQTSDTHQLDGLEEQIDDAQALLESRLHRRSVLQHMKTRLDVNQVAFDAHIKGMEEALNASSREFEEVKLLMRQLETGNANAQEALRAASERIGRERELRNKQLAHRRQEAANAKRMEEWREKREKARMMLDAELDGDLSEEGERQLIAAVKESAAQDEELERLQRHATQAVSTYEEAFNAIREATGVRSLDEMVEKFLGQSANKQALVEEKFEVEQRQRKLKEELARVQTEFAEFKAAGIGGSELNREMYDKLDNEILEARHELKIKQGVNERLEKVLLQVRAGMLGLMGRLAPFKQVLAFEDDPSGLVSGGGALNMSAGSGNGGNGAHGLAGGRSGLDIIDLTNSCESKLTRLLDAVSLTLQSQSRAMASSASSTSTPAHLGASAADGPETLLPVSDADSHEFATLSTGSAQAPTLRPGETIANLNRQCNMALSLLDTGDEVTHINNIRVRPRRAIGNGDLGTPISTARSSFSDDDDDDDDDGASGSGRLGFGADADDQLSQGNRSEDEGEARRLLSPTGRGLKGGRRNIKTATSTFSSSKSQTSSSSSSNGSGGGRVKSKTQIRNRSRVDKTSGLEDKDSKGSRGSDNDEDEAEQGSADDDVDVEDESEDENVVCDAATLKERSRMRVQRALDQQRAHHRRQRTLSNIKGKKSGQDHESLDRLAQPSKHHRRANRKTIYERPDLA